MRSKYCPVCGIRLVRREIGDEGTTPFCIVCKKPVFDSFYTCTINLVINEFDEVALVKQSYGVTDRYVLVAGFVKPEESAEDCSSREVHEEIGLVTQQTEFIKSYPLPIKDQLMLGFVCKVKKSDFIISEELTEAKWFSFTDALVMLNESSIAKQLLLDYLEKHKYI